VLSEGGLRVGVCEGPAPACRHREISNAKMLLCPSHENFFSAKVLSLARKAGLVDPSGVDGKEKARIRDIYTYKRWDAIGTNVPQVSRRRAGAIRI